MQGLFRNYDTTFLPLVRPHLERLVRETSREKHEYSHRLAAEIIAGLVRGAKHWDFDRVSTATASRQTDPYTVLSTAPSTDWSICLSTAL